MVDPAEVNVEGFAGPEVVDKPKYLMPVRARLALSSNVLAVVVPGFRDMDWAVYIGAVPGMSHDREYAIVAANGQKQGKRMATFLFPEFDPDLYRE